VPDHAWVNVARCPASLAAVLVTIALSMALTSEVSAHGGRLNASGCHNDNKNGGYHCHRSSSSPPRASTTRRPGDSVHYKNCNAARDAGAAPVKRGEPGYGSHLDRDGDGIGCE
jgi:hypothetical protein